MLTITMNSINWTIGQSYELVEKGGTIYELGTLQAILKYDSMKFKKADGDIHTYQLESGVTYRLTHRSPQTLNTPNMGQP
jgi:hypothetical protein